MSALTVEEPTNSSLTIDLDSAPQFELNGGESSISIEETGTVVQIFESEPEITDLLAQYILASN